MQVILASKAFSLNKRLWQFLTVFSYWTELLLKCYYLFEKDEDLDIFDIMKSLRKLITSTVVTLFYYYYIYLHNPQLLPKFQVPKHLIYLNSSSTSKNFTQIKLQSSRRLTCFNDTQCFFFWNVMILLTGNELFYWLVF